MSRSALEATIGQVWAEAQAFRTLGQMKPGDLAGKLVGLRIDCDVSLSAAREIVDGKLAISLSTLRRLLSAKARVALLSHAEAALDEANQVQGAACRRLSDLLGASIPFVHQVRGKEVRDAVERLNDGEALMLGNLAHEPAEAENASGFARYLTDLFDVYCDEAFSLAHDVRASTVRAVSMARVGVAGLDFERAYDILSSILRQPTRPFLAVFGGAISVEHMLLIESIAARADVVLVGGEVCLPFLKAAGSPTGSSPIPDEATAIARRILDTTRARACPVIGPRDFVTVDSADPSLSLRSLCDGYPPANCHLTDAGDLHQGQIAVDIGVDTRWSWGEQLATARTVFWHGPLGICESPALAEGTLSFAQEIASRTWPSLHQTVICGELLAAFLRSVRIPGERVDYVTPAGRTALHYAAGRTLPAVQALRRSLHPGKAPTALLVLSGSGEDADVAEFAAAWLPVTSAIHCIHVEHGPDEDRYRDLQVARSGSERMKEERRATGVFAAAEAILARSGFTPAECAHVRGNPAGCVIRHASRIGAGVIVMSRTRDREKIASAVPAGVVVLPHAG